MARTTKRGTCDLCGANSNVGTNHGSKACTNCTHIQSALSKRPQSVANAIRAMGKTEEMLSALIPAGGLAVHVTADLLREISDIVGYDGEDPAELVAAVREVAKTCASCDAEDVLHEIREIVGYTDPRGDKGLADAVRAFADRRPAGVRDCSGCDAAAALIEIADLVGTRGASPNHVVEAVLTAITPGGDAMLDDLLRAVCDRPENAPKIWNFAAGAAIQTIAELINRRDDLLALLTTERADNARLYEEKKNGPMRRFSTLSASLKTRSPD